MDSLLSVINVEAVTTMFVAYLPKVIAGALIFSAFVFLYNISKKPLAAAGKRIDLEPPIIRLLVHSIYKWLVIIFGLLIALKQLDVDVGAVLAGMGVAGIAIGFAAQDTISNIIAGFIVFIDKPFSVGHWIEVDGNYGKVHEITLRSTRIQTLNHTYVVLPNKNMVDTTLVNHSKYGATRVEIPVGIAYKENIAAAKEVLLTAMAKLDNLSKDHEVTVVVDSLGDSSVNLVIRVWIHNAAHEKPVYFAAMEAAKLALDEAGIEIPFPHLQLFVDEVKDKAAKQLQTVFQS